MSSGTTRRKKTTNDGKTDWRFVERVLRAESVRTIYLYGPPGVGKTFSAYNTGRIDNGVYAVTLTEDTPAAELRGHYMPRGGHMTWHDGPFTCAMRTGACLVVNEISHAAPEVLALLYPVLESPETARITLPNNETVRPAAGFRVICTDNEPPDRLPEALRDRFDSTLEVGQPHPEAIAALEEPLRSAALRAFALESDRRVSLRNWLSIQRLLPEFGLRGACIAVLGQERGSQIHDAIVLADADE